MLKKRCLSDEKKLNIHDLYEIYSEAKSLLNGDLREDRSRLCQVISEFETDWPKLLDRWNKESEKQ